MARISIDDAFIKQIQTLMNTDSPAKVTEEALTLLNWAANEVKSGRTIFSADSKAGNIHKLAMPSLTKIEPEKADSGV